LKAPEEIIRRRLVWPQAVWKRAARTFWGELGLACRHQVDLERHVKQRWFGWLDPGDNGSSSPQVASAFS